MVRQDPANDLALLKAEGTLESLFVRGSRGIRLGDRVSTVGYPNVTMQGSTPKYASGDIAAVTGIGDDPRFFQISIPVQPGNSGSPLVDANGQVIGVIAAKLSEQVALETTGSLPENVNYAVRGSFVLNLMESVPGLMDAAMPAPARQDRHEVAQRTSAASGLVLVER